MNYKALAAGAVLGFLIALTPACGSSQAECGPNNCAGCCNADGTCVETAAQTGLACGASGQTCVQCAANQQCTAGTCTVITNPGGSDGGPDGGGGGCGPQTCSGCCTGTGVCLPGTANTNCGAAGAACQPCPTTASCTSLGANMGGACQTPDAGSSGDIGKACTTNADCASIAGGVCKLTTTTGNAQYPGGYCTKLCNNQGDTCPGTSVCIGTSNYGEGDAICADSCSSSDPCRTPGYACYNVSGGATPASVCWLDPLPTPPAAPADLVGSACADDVNCQADGGFIPGFCIPSTEADGGPSGFTDGYCSASCQSNATCGTTGICIGFSQNNAFCTDKCTAPNAGQSDCRTDYICEGYLIGFADGGTAPSTDGFCWPSCNAPGNPCPTGRTCSTLGYCLLPDGGM